MKTLQESVSAVRRSRRDMRGTSSEAETMTPLKQFILEYFDTELAAVQGEILAIQTKHGLENDGEDDESEEDVGGEEPETEIVTSTSSTLSAAVDDASNGAVEESDGTIPVPVPVPVDSDGINESEPENEALALMLKASIDPSAEAEAEAVASSDSNPSGGNDEEKRAETIRLGQEKAASLEEAIALAVEQEDYEEAERLQEEVQSVLDSLSALGVTVE